MKLLVLIAFLLAPGVSLRAQTPAAQAPIEQDKIELWKCKTPAGSYTVAIRAITAVSSHEYIVDAVARVSEVNIDTTGNMSVRFYFLEPLTPSVSGFGEATINKLQEMAETAAEKTGQGEIWRKVVKNYPTTTHSRTVEYRVESKAELEKVFKSADTSFRLQRPGTVRLP